MSRQLQLTVNQILSARQLPGVLYSDEAAFLLRKSPDDLHLLAKKNLIKEIGDPQPNAPKYYLTEEVLSKKDDPQWQDQAVRILTRKNRVKNDRYKSRKQSRSNPSSLAADNTPIAPPRILICRCQQMLPQN